MSEYYKAEDIMNFLNRYCPKDMWEYQIADLPTIDIVPCEDCRWGNDCSRMVKTLDGLVSTALTWCSDGKRRDNE